MLIQALKIIEQWTSTTHRVMLSTFDSNYDDATIFDLQVYVPRRAVQDKARLVEKRVFCPNLV